MTYAKSKETIRNILEAARTLFVEKNYANVTIADIAAQANVSTGALYHHFSSKEDIYLQMMHRYLKRMRTIMVAALDESTGSCRERLHKSILAFLDLPDELGEVLQLVRRDINIFADPMRRELIHAYHTAIPEPLEAVLRDGIASGELKCVDARVLSWELVAMVEVALAPYSRRTLGEPEDISDFVLSLLMDGVATHNQTETMEPQFAAR
jgi:AcrR family transcriptional regulator